MRLDGIGGRLGLVALAAAGLAAPAPADAKARPASPPSVTVVEVGEDGRIFDGVPFLATLAVETHDPFRGRLDVEAWVGDVELGERHVFPMDLGADAKQVVVATMTATGSSNLRYRLRAESGRVVGVGRVELDSRVADGVLHLTLRDGSGLRRDPARAFRSSQPYLAHAVIVVAAGDFDALDEIQEQALLDAVACGRLLILVGLPDELREPLRSTLAVPEALAWQDDSGGIVREIGWSAGHVRLTDRDILGDESAGGPWFDRFVAQPWPLRPSLLELTGSSDNALWALGQNLNFDGTDELQREVDALAGMPEGLRFDPTGRPGPRELPASARRSVVAGLSLIVVLGFVASGSALRPRLLSRRAARAFSLVLVAAPFACAALFARSAIEPARRLVELRYHDAHGRADVISRQVELRGGAGLRAERLAMRWDGRGGEVLPRWRPDPVPREVVHDGAGGALIGSLPQESSGGRPTRVFGLEAADATSSWTTRLRWNRGRIEGTITARRSFEMAALVAPPRIIALGSVAAGTVLDAGQLLELRAAPAEIPPAALVQAILMTQRTAPFVPALGRARRDPLSVVGIVERVGPEPLDPDRLVLDLQPLAIAGEWSEASGTLGLLIPATHARDASRCCVPTVGGRPSLPLDGAVTLRRQPSPQRIWRLDWAPLVQLPDPDPDPAGFACLGLESGVLIPYHSNTVLVALRREAP